MKSLKSAARRGVIVSVTAVAALALASCSAGHNSQTADQVAAVDGTAGETADGIAAVRDVQILVEPSGEAALKFTLVNQGYDGDKFSLKSVNVDGQDVQLGSVKEVNRDWRIVADSADNLKRLGVNFDSGNGQMEGEQIQYVETSLKNDDYGYAGYRPVTFELSNGTIEVNAAISATQMESGQYNRDVKSTEGYTTEAPGAHDDHGHGDHGDHEGHDH